MSARLLVCLALIAVGACSVGKSTYAMSHPFAYKDWMEAFLPTSEHVVQENSTKVCNEWVKLCIDDGAKKACAPTQPQIHSVGAYARESGTVSLTTQESYFTQALGGMEKYDPFMELHVGLYTSDIDSYIAAFKAADVPTFASTFEDPTTHSTYYSILVQVNGSLQEGAGSLLALELIGNQSHLLSRPLHHHSAFRASPRSLQHAHVKHDQRASSSSSKPALTLLHVSWPSSNVTAMSTYFEQVLGGQKVAQVTGDDGSVTYYGHMWDDDTVELRWSQSKTVSQGPWSVADWESYASSLHSKCISCPNQNNQGFDRLADQHIGGHSNPPGALDGYITAQISAGYPYRVYSAPSGSPNFLYLYGPNGWGYQITGTCESDCGENLVFYDECTQGTTGHCSKDLPTAVGI